MKEETGTIYQHAIEHLKEADFFTIHMNTETQQAVTNALDAVIKEEKEYSAKKEEGEIRKRIVNILEKLGKIDDVENIVILGPENETVCGFVFKTNASMGFIALNLSEKVFMYHESTGSIIAGNEK